MGITLAAFVIGIGFVTSALVYRADCLVRGQPASFVVNTQSPFSLLPGFFLCMFAGPYVVAECGLRYWNQGIIPAGLFVLSLVLALLWSFCSGIVVAQLLAVLGILQV